MNKNQFDNSKLPFLDRAITVEGNGFSYKELVKSASLTEILEKSCKAIDKHLGLVFDKPSIVHSMKLLFKQDALDRVNLLLCSSIKVDSSIGETSLKRLFDTVPRYSKYGLGEYEEDQKSVLSVTKLNTREFKCRRCAICLSAIHSNELYEINNKTLVEMHEFYRKSPMKGKTGFMNEYFSETTISEKEIPSAIQNLYPGISYKSYLDKKEDPVWQCEVARICTNCWTVTKRLYPYLR